MNINLGKYLETEIKFSKYTKKELCNKLNELYTFGDKPLSYTTFSNNVKNGEITFNEIIAIATLIDSINLNKVVLVYKNQLNKNINKGEFHNMIKNVLKIFNENTIAGVTYEKENIYEVAKYEVYEALYLSDDCKTVILERIDISNEKGYIQEVAHFTNFDEVLREYDMTINEFNGKSLNEKLDFVAQEGQSELDILGKEMNENSFSLDGYLD